MGEMHKEGAAPTSFVMHRLLDYGDLVSMDNAGATYVKDGRQIDLFPDALNCYKFEETRSFVANILKNPCCDENASLLRHSPLQESIMQ